MKLLSALICGILISFAGMTAASAQFPPGRGARESGFTLKGVVTDEKKRPIEGVAITLMMRDMDNPVYFGHQFQTQTTDEDGEYEFSNVALTDWQMSAHKPGYIASKVERIPQGAANETQILDISLVKAPPGGVITGKVVDADGKSIRGAQVTNATIYYGVRQATTNDQGSYRLDNVGWGPFGPILHVHAPGFAPKAVKFVAGTKEVPAQVDVTLVRGRRIRGQVVDEGGAPIAEAYVSHSNYYGRLGGSMDTTVTTDADGSFRFDDLPQAVTFTIRKHEYTPLDNQTLPLDGDDVVLVTLTKEPKREKPAGVITGRVVDAVTGAVVTVFDVQAINAIVEDKVGYTYTSIGIVSQLGGSSDGKFDLKGFTEDELLLLKVEAAGYHRGFLQNVVPRPEGKFEPLEIKLQPIDAAKLQTIAGQLVDVAGHGIGGLELRLIVSAVRRTEPRDELAFSWDLIRDGRVDDVAELGQFLTAMTDQEGRFEFSEVQPAEDIELVYWGNGIIPGRRAGVEKLEGVERKQLRIVTEATGRVTGKVDRQRLPECDSVILKNGEETFHGKLSFDGLTYEVDNVPAGTYELQATQVIIDDKRPNGISGEIVYREQVEVKSGETTIINLVEKYL